MAASTVGSVVTVSYRNTLRYMFSTVQASWPVSPTSTMTAHRRAASGAAAAEEGAVDVAFSSDRRHCRCRGDGPVSRPMPA